MPTMNTPATAPPAITPIEGLGDACGIAREGVELGAVPPVVGTACVPVNAEDDGPSDGPAAVVVSSSTVYMM